MIIEVRTYHVKPGLRDRFLEFFHRHAVPLQQSCGMRVMGPFVDLEVQRVGGDRDAHAGPLHQRAHGHAARVHQRPHRPAHCHGGMMMTALRHARACLLQPGDVQRPCGVRPLRVFRHHGERVPAGAGVLGGRKQVAGGQLDRPLPALTRSFGRRISVTGNPSAPASRVPARPSGQSRLLRIAIRWICTSADSAPWGQHPPLQKRGWPSPCRQRTIYQGSLASFTTGPHRIASGRRVASTRTCGGLGESCRTG
jgi:hypothetical protein